MKTTFCSLLLIFILSVITIDAADDWIQKFPSSKPLKRWRSAAAYIGDDKALLFGGEDSNGNLDDTWVYDLSDNSWTQKSPTFSGGALSARYNHAMAYIGDDKVLLFGGYPPTDDTWVYDLSDNTWTKKNPSSKPSARYSHAMAYIDDDKVVLFGDYNHTDENAWVYDLSDNVWTQKSISGPSARYSHAMAYIGGDKVVLFGGRTKTESYNDETWVYDLSGNAWTQKSPSSKPSARMFHAMAYIGGDRVVLFGGKTNTEVRNNETWVYDLSDNRWTQDTNATQPSARREHTLSETSMDGSSYLVLFGGEEGSGLDDETWTFGGGDYSLPVELSFFTAASKDGTVILLWRAETEVNNLGFSIYRGEEIDGSYTRIAFVSGAGNSAMPNDYQFMDSNVEPGRIYFYYLEDVDLAGERRKSRIIKIVVPPAKPVLPIPKEFRLLQNFPNPFNPETWIPYQLAEATSVEIRIYDTKGRLVRKISLGRKGTGFYKTKETAAYWDGRDNLGQPVASGIYLYQIKARGFTKTRRMVVVK